MQKLIHRHGNKINFLLISGLMASGYGAMHLCFIIWQNSPTLLGSMGNVLTECGRVLMGM